MNCFGSADFRFAPIQIVFLYRSLTTCRASDLAEAPLWIALASPISASLQFKLYFYIGLWQRYGQGLTAPYGCELLWLRRFPLRSNSNCIFISVFDNNMLQQELKSLVVNCFQIVFLYRSLTTPLNFAWAACALWIAFKLYFYIGLWQPTVFFALRFLSCELLSNCIFISVFDNPYLVPGE